jgi:hypothetical protein
MKRIILALAFVLACVYCLNMQTPTSLAFDAFEEVCNGVTDEDGAPAACPQGTEDPITGKEGIIIKIVQILSFVIGAAAVIMVIIGGLKYITSNGDSNSVSSAKNTILYALIGIAVFLLSQAIVLFVIKRV